MYTCEEEDPCAINRIPFDTYRQIHTDRASCYMNLGNNASSTAPENSYCYGGILRRGTTVYQLLWGCSLSGQVIQCSPRGFHSHVTHGRDILPNSWNPRIPSAVSLYLPAVP